MRVGGRGRWVLGRSIDVLATELGRIDLDEPDRTGQRSGFANMTLVAGSDLLNTSTIPR